MAAVDDKAQRLADSDAVYELDGARVFCVQGDHATYLVVLHPDMGAHCTCPSRGTCSHILAARAAGGLDAGSTA